MTARCFECGAEAHHDHHVVPRSLGGTKTVPLCEEHHGAIHGADLRTRTLTRKALQAKRARGERGGGVPYGFTADAQGRLSLSDAEQANIALVVAMRRAGKSYRAIVDSLARRGIASRTGAPFALTQVHRIVREWDAGRSRSVSVVAPVILPADRDDGIGSLFAGKP